ncbi:MAG TPA: hypothetical protein VFR34_03120 [Paracoccaceae bacterium]|nr:hypothetical protein [Paracoccaceae bacterium]
MNVDLLPGGTYTFWQKVDILEESMSDTRPTGSMAHRRPGRGTRTGRVWEIADEISERTGIRASRREVVERFVAEGGNPRTAHTQYQYWKKANEAQGGPTMRQSGTTDPEPLDVAPDGRLLIPMRLREAMLLDSGGRVMASVVDGELRLISPRVALRKLRQTARALVPEGASVVDEFIAEKRLEAERE